MDEKTTEELTPGQKWKAKELKKYIRVGPYYFKLIKKTDRYGIERTEIKKWIKQEILQDFGKDAIYDIKKFDDFTIAPDNTYYHPEIKGCYNLYSKFAHEAEFGTWKWTKILIEHIFGEQYEQGIKYLQCLYLHPKQALPVLALVSKERATAKSTFLDWLTIMFGANMCIIDSNNLKSDFNGIYAQANIIGIEEAFVEKSASVEKVKALSTQKTITMNIKGVQHSSIPFFGKVIMNSNNEDKFIKIDNDEIRFFVRKTGKPKHTNHNILNDLRNEIPAFLYYLENRPKIDFTKSRMVFTPEELKNTTLDSVKEESQSGLSKEIKILFEDYFNNEFTGDKTEPFYASASDIKKFFFERNNNYETAYIRRVLKTEMECEYVQKTQRYVSFVPLTPKMGHPFKFYPSDFIDINAEKIENEAEKVPF